MRYGRMTAFCMGLLTATAVFAAPKKPVQDPVADGFPAWTGVTAENHIAGRELASASDLRQRVATVVVEFDAQKLVEQLTEAGDFASICKFYTLGVVRSIVWESAELPRDAVVIYVAHNVQKRGAVVDALKDCAKNPGLFNMNRNFVPVYENVTFKGAPDGEGKLPFVYVVGHEGTEILFQGTADKATYQKVSKMVDARRKKLGGDLVWRPYYGYVKETKYATEIDTALAKEKSLEPVLDKLRKDILAPGSEVAKEAQMLYDGLEQTRSDMMFVASLACQSSPHIAAHRIDRLLKLFPSVKKKVASMAKELKANAAAQPLIKMYPQLVRWSDPGFSCKNAGQVKKILAELNKMKKTLAPLKEQSGNLSVQNGALVLDAMVDELISTIPSKVSEM